MLVHAQTYVHECRKLFKYVHTWNKITTMIRSIFCFSQTKRAYIIQWTALVKSSYIRFRPAGLTSSLFSNHCCAHHIRSNVHFCRKHAPPIDRMYFFSRFYHLSAFDTKLASEESAAHAIQAAISRIQFPHVRRSHFRFFSLCHDQEFLKVSCRGTV